MKFKKSAIVSLALSAAAFSLPAFLVENAGELVDYLPQSIHPAITQAVLFYQRWSMGPREPESRYTTVVGLSEKDFPGAFGDSCRQREIFSGLAPRLAEAGATAIVLDIAFSTARCVPDPKGSTAKLQSALQFVSKRAPVIVGQTGEVLHEETNEDRRAWLIGQGMDRNGVISQPIVDFAGKDGNVKVGLIRIEADPQRIPLKWPVYQEISGDKPGITFTEMQPTLSLQTAEAVRASFPRGTEALENFTKSGVHPYTTLLPRNAFLEVHAADVLSDGPKHDQSYARVRGKITVVGWVDISEDTHATSIESSLPGVFLQANYIESLLDGRVLRAFPRLEILILTWLGWFALIEIPFHVPAWKYHRLKAMLAAVVMWFFVFVTSYYVLVVGLGWYLAALPPSLLALGARCLYELVSDNERDSKSTRSKHTPSAREARSKGAAR